MRFRYSQYRAKQPILTLGGRKDRPYPEVNVSLVGPTDTRVVRGLLDTGADDTIFPESWATLIGLDLTGAPTGTFMGAVPGMVSVRYAKATLRLASNGERHEWAAFVGFTPGPLRIALLGYAGFLQFFSATFHGDREEVELAVNSLYSGT